MPASHEPSGRLRAMLRGGEPLLTLAPMQEVTDLAFWTLIHQYGGADVYWTEYFRVHSTSTPERRILHAITNHTTGRPVIAQLIGNDPVALVRTAKILQEYPVAAIDLNLGCPAPIVYRKCAGGGLLREPERIDAILGALRDAVQINFTVKTRLGFESIGEFDRLLAIFAKHSLDALTVHARTVAQLYRLPVHYDRIRHAVDVMPCPVIANGHVYSAAQAESLLAQTGARGLMIGRGAIRNPWLFDQIRRRVKGQHVALPTGRQVADYIRALWETQAVPGRAETVHCSRMKKFLNYLGEGVPGAFRHQVNRSQTAEEFFRICRDFLDHDEPMAMLPAELTSEPFAPAV
ncbi:MAG TPA: tRNA-dihydrouridine synthase family protein [Vicinamibacterales bacterium]